MERASHCSFRRIASSFSFPLAGWMGGWERRGEKRIGLRCKREMERTREERTLKNSNYISSLEYLHV